MDCKKTTRRGFIETSLLGLAGSALAPGLIDKLPATVVKDGMPYRELGKTGEKISLLGIGGYHIGMAPEADALRLMQEAFDGGVNFVDNAWEYHRGVSEERMGKAIEGRRDKVFVMTKHHGRDKKTAMQHLEDSLRRLKTDVIDLWQFHEIVYDDDADMIFAPGGGIEAAELAKKQGKVRYIGFTGHKDPMMHLKMLAYGYPWDAVQMPLSILDGSFKSFEKWVLPVLVKRGIGVLAMKTRASGPIVKNGIASPDECWRYVAALPVSTIISGMESVKLLRDNLRMARELEPMTAAEIEAVKARTKEVALTGTLERFKTSTAFDGPVGRKLHQT